MEVPRFWRETGSRYRLVATECENCGRVYFPKRDFCPVCHRESIGKLKEKKLSGKGKIESYTIIHRTHSEI